MSIFKKKKQATISKKQFNEVSNLIAPKYNGRIMKKSLKIGDFEFTIGINRSLALDGLNKNKEYWDIIQSPLAQEIHSDNFNYVEFIQKDPTRVVDFLKMQEDMAMYSEKIVRYLLPKMLEYGNTFIGKCKDYNEYSKKLLDYCEDNNVLYDWQDDDIDETDESFTEEEMLNYAKSKYHKGLINTLMEFIQLGFTQGDTPSTPKIKITEM